MRWYASLGREIKLCGYCGAAPVVSIQINGLVDIYCPSPDSKCYPGAWVSHKDLSQAINEWNDLYGKG